MVGHGEVWWYEPPDVGRRPYLILTRPGAIGVLNQLIAAPVTRTLRDIPTEVALDASDGLPTECAVSLDNITLIRPEFCTRRITALGPERLRQVCDALTRAVAC